MKGNKLESSENWSESKFKALFPHSADVQIHNFRLEDDGGSEVILIYSEGLCDTTQIGRVVLPQLKNMYRQHGFTDLQGDNVYGTLPIHPIEAKATPVEVAELLFQGDLLLLFPQTSALFRMCIGHRSERTPEESSTEISIKGPKDGFVEDIIVNVSLIRKRIRSNSLCYETVTLGRRTRTRVGLLYIDDIISLKY